MLDISYYIDKCRFCYSQITNEDSIDIDNNVITQFYLVITKELIISPKLSNILCKGCHKKLTLFHDFKKDVSEKQEKLYTLLNEDEIQLKDEPNVQNETVENYKDVEEYIEDIDENIQSDVVHTDPIETTVKKNSSSSSYPCLMCKRTFSENRKLKLHVSRVHKISRKCEYCEFTASNKNELLKHVKASHIQKENQTDLRICPDCGKILKGNNHLNFHIKTKHLKMTKYECDLCPFRSYGKYEIRSHILIHHLPLELRKEFKCDLCPSVLTTAMSLKTHKTHKHSNLRPFQCVFCYKNYSLKETLKSHIRSVHNGERKYKCPHCTKGYNSNNRLSDHINNTHGKKQEIPCEKCGKVFNSLRNLQTHAIYHEDPTLQCTYCDKLFYIKKNLREHQDSVHLGVTYQCEVCQKKFQSTSGLRRHSKSHNK
ncbi:hypothetical protein PVAND_014024 [Polypedilum vanderplanki]|uniref:Zinc finger protein n=1 Tax=Polypedilum vanderplanki TaxID=319348 RepID=A0A9J6CT85_POLVA|nr:hypothetical protein PVAND_014024 [Polypedilum vanderplanki]